MITVSEEKFSVVEENQHLIESHWGEVAIDGSGRKLDVDWEAFRRLDKSGSLVTIVARDNGEVAGYAVFATLPHLHARQTFVASNDALFLRKESRKGRAGALLIKESKRILAEKFGDVLVMWHVKPHVDFSPILLRDGYKMHETIYSCRATRG